MDSIGALGLGVVALSMLALSNNDKKETNNKNEKIEYSTSNRLFSVSSGDTITGTESAGGNPEYAEINIKNNMNNYILYKKKYLKQKKLLKNMKGGAVAASAPKFDTIENVNLFIKYMYNIYNQVIQNMRISPICITGSSAIALVLYSLELFDELFNMQIPSDVDILYHNIQGFGIGDKFSKLFDNIQLISGDAQSSTWAVNGIPLTFDLTGIPGRNPFNYFSLVIQNRTVNILDLKSLKRYYQDDTSFFSRSSVEEEFNKKKERLTLLNNIIKYITDKKLESNYGMESTVSTKPSISFSNLGSSSGGGGLFGNSNSGTPGTPVAPTYSSSVTSPVVNNLFASPGVAASPLVNKLFGTPSGPVSPVNFSNSENNQQNVTPVKKGGLFDDI